MIDVFPCIWQAHGRAGDGSPKLFSLDFFCVSFFFFFFFFLKSPLNAVTGRATGTHALCCSPSRRRLCFFLRHPSTTTAWDVGGVVAATFIVMSPIQREERTPKQHLQPIGEKQHPSTTRKSVRRSNTFNQWEERTQTDAFQNPGPTAMTSFDQTSLGGTSKCRREEPQLFRRFNIPGPVFKTDYFEVEKSFPSTLRLL